jgi:hypothetical protein
MFNSDNYIITETEECITYKSKEKNKDGFRITVSFTKDPKKHEESMKAIKEFFLREIF